MNLKKKEAGTCRWEQDVNRDICLPRQDRVSEPRGGEEWVKERKVF